MKSPNVEIERAIAAARAGDAEGVESWLRAGGDPNRYDAEGWTPLLAAAVRGRAVVVEKLLSHSGGPANPDMAHARSGALPIHFAGHSGDVRVAELLLAVRPSHLDEVWELNGHTLLLQAVFYGHLGMAEFALRRGANTAATTVRGLGGMEFARQFQNQPMMDLIGPYDKPVSEKEAYYLALLKHISPVVPPDEEAEQRLSDRLIAAIEGGIRETARDSGAASRTLAAVRDLVEVGGARVNRLGGPLQQPALTVVVTGNNGNPASSAVTGLRKDLAALLLEKGADPMVRERHPMGATAVIRAAVFNHLDIIKMMGERLSPERLADALNEIPVVNGLTALHDTVLRGSMVGPDRMGGYLEQIRWFVAHGARSDIEDFSGRTQRRIAEEAPNADVRSSLLEALEMRTGIGTTAGSEEAQMVCLMVTVKVKQDSGPGAREALRELEKQSASHAGAVLFRWFQHEKEPTKFTLVEQWASKEDVDAHIKLVDAAWTKFAVNLDGAPVATELIPVAR